MTDPTFFNQLLVWPIINLLIGLYKIFVSIGLLGALGWAIIGMTVLIRGAMHPLTHKQMESAQKMQALKPKIEKIQKKYKDDKQKQQSETMKLYQREGINPAAGCLPLLIQMPFIYGLFWAFRNILTFDTLEQAAEAINTIMYVDWLKIDALDISFFGVDLSLFPSQWQEHGVWLLSIPVITGAFTYFQTKIMMDMQAPPPQKKKPAKKNEKKPDDFAAEMQKQMKFIMPIAIGVFSYNFPVGLALYWNTYTLFAIATRNHFKKPHNA